MNISSTCPNCGSILPANSPEGLCPACLMSGGIPTQADPAATLIVERPKRRKLPRVGETFGGYRIEHELGHGGMGAVYAAVHLETGRRVALKVLSHQLDSPEARARFLREGRLAASINHPNSVYVFGTEEIEGTPVISMELIAGGTLQERVQRSGPLPVGEAVDAALQIIAGLEAAQAIGILHRDIKPANCFEDTDGTVKVGDFGLSISTAARGESHLTLQGTFLGTPAFCSPEQLRGDELNVRSDMYSVGVTLFYLLTGRTPFEGRNMVQVLASALEKPAPSPTQFRAEIPQSLSQVVLRCLEKLPASRFGSYEELRGALLPFNSTAPSPATLGLRFVAEIVDGVVLTAMNFALMALLSGAFTGTTAARFNNPQWLVYSLGGFVLVQLYWGILEGVWGASVGKALVGLRVARLNRGTPGIPRALARQLILGWTTLPFSLAAFVLPELDDPQSRTAQLWSALFLGLQAAYVLGIFCTARRRNGFAAVHDLLTGTRVTQKSAYQARTLVSQDETPVATKEAMPVLGPYHVLASLEATGDSEILLGYDTRLLRQVWIRKTKAGEPAVPPALRNISRPGRLRWLQGERNATGSWDAYEVVSGKPLPGLLTERRPWASVRNWLHDLAAELEACAKDGSTPGVLSLDRVWITADGRAKLLDFAAPGTQPKERGQTGAAPCEPRTFLNRVAMSALEGRVASAEEASGRTVSAPLALSARAFLHDLIAPSSNGTFAEKLKPLLQEAPSVAWWKRLAMVLVFVAPVVFVTLFMVLGTQLYQRWQKEQPEIVSMLNCLIAHHDLEHGNSPLAGTGLNVPEARAALEIVIAGRYRHIVHDEKAWSSPACRMAINHDQRAVAERIVAAHPHVGEDELKTAEALVQPLIGAREEKLPEMGPMMNRVAARMIGWMLEAMAVLSLVCALVFRRGPLFGILGIAVVTKGGAEASRLRMLGRGVIAWSPALLCGVMVKHLPPAGGGISSFMAFLLAALVIASLARRERGLQDLLAGTWLVPGN